MDLHKEWQKLQAEKFDKPKLKKEEIMEAIYKESKSAISTLTKRMRYKTYWSVAFTVIFGAGLLASLGNAELALVLGVCVTYFGVSFMVLYAQYKKLASLRDLGGQTLQVLRAYYKRIKSTLTFEEVFGMFFLPIAVICGMLTSLILGGKTIVEIFGNTKILIVMLIAIIIITPLGIIFSRAMNKKAFGCFIDKLKDYIKELERLD